MNFNHSHNLYAGNFINYDEWKSYTVTWISTSQDVSPKTDDWIANNPTGYWDELEKVGSQVAIPALPTSNIAELRPVVSLSNLKNANEILFKSLSFHCLDVKSLGSEVQDSATNTAITNSLSSDNNALTQTRFLNSVPPDWQPNYFRPSCLVDNRDILGNFASTTNYGGGSNQGDKSIGLPLPLSYQFDYHFSNVKDIKLYALCYQYIQATNNFKRYAVVAHADFLYR